MFFFKQLKAILFSDKNISYYFGLGIVWSFHAVMTSLWLFKDQHHYPWDLGSHQLEALAFHDYISLHEVLLHKIKGAAYYYPPLFHIIGGLLENLTNRHPDTLAYTNLFYLAIIMWGSFILGSWLYNKRTGFLSALFISFFPGISTYSRLPFIDISLTAVVLISLVYLYRTMVLHRFDNNFPLHSSFLGICIGLGLIVKWTYGFFIIFPVLIVVLFPKSCISEENLIGFNSQNNNSKKFPNEGKNTEFWKHSYYKLFVNILIFFLDITIVFFFGACLWIIKNGSLGGFLFKWENVDFSYQLLYFFFLLTTAIGYLLSRYFKTGLFFNLTRKIRYKSLYALWLLFIFSFLSMYNWYKYSLNILIPSLQQHIILKGIAQNEPAILSIKSILYYLDILLNNQLLAANFFLFLVGSIVILYRHNKSDVFLLITFWSPYIIFSLIRNKDIRFTLPFLPIVAIISLFWLTTWQKKQIANYILIILLAVNIFQYVNCYNGLFSHQYNISFNIMHKQISLFRSKIQFVGKPENLVKGVYDTLDYLQHDLNLWKSPPSLKPGAITTFERRKVLIFSNHWFQDQYSFRYWCKYRKNSLLISKIDGRSPLLFHEALHSGYLLGKNNGLGEEAKYGEILLKLLLSKKINNYNSKFLLIKSFLLPDGSKSLLWKRKPFPGASYFQNNRKKKQRRYKKRIRTLLKQ